jgi:DeoR/GlpR family transcriptional regulator of sugar metabolism
MNGRIPLAEQRRAQLLELVRTRRFASLPELAGELHVSESTIRRDLELLEELGLVRRVHGGVLYIGAAPALPHFEARQPVRREHKQAIAQHVATMIEDGDSLILDGGTTTFEVARLILGRPLHVVTNSLPIADLLAPHPNSDLVLIGGNICSRTGVAMGPFAVEMLAKLRVRRTILSVAAINEEGCFNNNRMLVETERAMLRAGAQVLVVADSSKFGGQSIAHLCPLSEIDVIITDNELAPEWRSRIEAAGVKIVLAPCASGAVPTGVTMPPPAGIQSG